VKLPEVPLMAEIDVIASGCEKLMEDWNIM
jgi:hypothetical protein